MHRTFKALLLLLALATPARAQQRDTTLEADIRGPRDRAIILATLGSAAGMLGGATALAGFCKVTGWGESGEDPCLGQLIIGGFAGSIIGSAVGAQIPAKTLGGLPIGYAIGGTVLGLGAGYLGGRLTGSPSGYLIAYSVTQGIITGILTTRTTNEPRLTK
jgi:hypothetical protein